MDTDVSIIIVNYKTSDLIVGCISSIQKHVKDINYEIFVVDNNSEPEFISKLSSRFPEFIKEGKLKFIELPENIGFGRANNEAIKIAKGRNIFFLNPDTLLKNNAVKILSDFLDSHPKAGACGGNLTDVNGLPTVSYKRVFPGVRDYIDAFLKYIPSKLIYRKNIHFNHTGQPLEVSFIVGADLMVKRDTLKETGAFDPSFFMFFEETDLCKRIKKSGEKIYSVPDSLIIHLEGQSFESGKYPHDTRIKMIETGRKNFLRLHQNTLHYQFSNFIYSLYLNSRIILSKDKAQKDYFRRRKNFSRS